MEFLKTITQKINHLRAPAELVDADRFPYERDWLLLLGSTALFGIILVVGFFAGSQYMVSTKDVSGASYTPAVKGINKDKLEAALQIYRTKTTNFEKMKAGN